MQAPSSAASFVCTLSSYISDIFSPLNTIYSYLQSTMSGVDLQSVQEQLTQRQMRDRCEGDSLSVCVCVCGNFGETAHRQDVSV